MYAPRFRLSPLPWTALLACCALPALGCRPIPEEIVAAGTPLQIYPADDARTLKGELNLHVLLDEAHQGQTPEGLLVWDEGELALDCTLSDDALEALCPVFDDVPEDQDYTLDVEVGPDAWTQRFDSRLPAPGLAWVPEDEVTVSTLGAGEKGRALFQQALEADPMIVILEGTDGASAGEATLLLGTASARAEYPWGIGKPGLTQSLTVSLDGQGGLQSDPVDTLLPVLTDDGEVVVPLLDTAVRGTYSATWLELQVTAVVPARGLLSLLSAYGVNPELALSLSPLDLDLDGDGVADAATLSFEVSGANITLPAWEE